jgi:O-acetyl-ADP-ribose deacetylase (regulator of RNase III)
MNIVKGDLIKLAIAGEFDVIIHGCNCFCTMGAGIARAIRSEFPEAFMADQATEKGDKTKLGGFSHADIERNGHSITVINAYTQFNYSGKGVKADYNAIKIVFRKVKSQFSGRRIGYPLIGAGLAGGDWKLIAEIINEEFKGENHTLVEFIPG